MLWRVDGVDRATGGEVMRVVQADSEREAAKRVRDEGVAPTRIAPESRDTPPEPTTAAPRERPRISDIRVFRVHGALAATGVNTSLVIEAYTPEQAQETARAQGVLASRIEHIADGPGESDGRRVQTIERTAKKWKSGMLWMGLTFLLGVAIAFAGEPAGISIAIIGLVGYLVVRGMAWWHHG